MLMNTGLKRAASYNSLFKWLCVLIFAAVEVHLPRGSTIGLASTTVLFSAYGVRARNVRTDIREVLHEKVTPTKVYFILAYCFSRQPLS